MTTALTDRAAARYRREHTARAQHRSNGALTALATLIAAAGVTAAIGSAIPVAHADTNDGKFLAALKSESITDHISPQHAIEAGHMVCQKLNGGATPTQVANDVLNSSTMPAYHSGFFVGASIKEYCPQYVP
ncbi:MAG TPA: DUF732 domain-containing protein [Mycobacterium sp.]|jgi:hypothetical protein